MSKKRMKSAKRIVCLIGAFLLVGGIFTACGKVQMTDTMLKKMFKSVREKQVEEIKATCDIRGEEFLVPRDGKKSVQTYLYSPQSGGENLPVLVNIHGGGWVGNDALVLDTQSGKLADRLGCLVVNLNYVKADEEPFPYCQEEARDVLE